MVVPQRADPLARLDRRWAALRVRLARHACVRVERREADEEHRDQERGPGWGECRLLGEGWRACERGRGWVCALVERNVPCLGGFVEVGGMGRQLRGRRIEGQSWMNVQLNAYLCTVS